MVSVEKAVIARITKRGEKFEILVDPEKALELKSGKDVSIDDILAAKEVYEDAKKGLRASDQNINKVFGTNELEKVVKSIIKEGEVQLTTEQRREMVEEKTKAIASTIAKRGVDPRTGTPHPVDRILRAMKEAKVRTDINKRIEEQVDSTLKAIQPILPIKFEKLQVAVKVPPAYAGRAANVIRDLGTILKEEWRSDGNYICLIEISAASQQDVYDRLNSLTHGEVEVKIVKKESL